MEPITVERKNGTAILHLDVSFTFDNISEIENFINRTIDEKPKLIAVNFRYVGLIDSVGIGHLVKLLKKTQMNDIELVLYDMNSTVIGLLKLSTMYKYFNIMTEDEFKLKYL